MDFQRHPWVDGEDRLVCLPATYVAELKARAIADVDGGILSTGDILFAWRTKLMVEVLGYKPSTPLGLLQPYSLRGLIDTLPASGAYTSNATAFAYARLTVSEVQRASLGGLAMQLRCAVKEYRTKEQAESYLGLLKRHGMMAVGPYNQVLMQWSNWSAGGHFDVDFGKARIGGEGRGSPAAIFTYAYMGRFKMRNAGSLIGKDADGNVWLNWSMRPGAWPRAKEMILNKQV
jgi:hypothetical protein